MELQCGFRYIFLASARDMGMKRRRPRRRPTGAKPVPTILTKCAGSPGSPLSVPGRARKIREEADEIEAALDRDDPSVAAEVGDLLLPPSISRATLIRIPKRCCGKQTRNSEIRPPLFPRWGRDSF